ncbi:MAG: hypothetical protein VX246_09930, partial [Myxococcota bacterium]|nr:hypothetical protein [Myxococcota bacterium]
VSMIQEAGLDVPATLANAAKSGSSERFFDHPQINRGRFFVAGGSRIPESDEFKAGRRNAPGEQRKRMVSWQLAQKSTF